MTLCNRCHDTRVDPLSSSGDDCADCWPLLVEGERIGERRILLEVAKLPSPVMGSWGPGEPIPNGCGPCVRITICEWCGGRGPHQGPVEHRNGCLWPRAMQAKEGK